MTFLESQHCESFKGCWHLGGLVFALGAAAYNVAAFLQRGDRHLLRNAALYGAMVVVEIDAVRHHFTDCA